MGSPTCVSRTRRGYCHVGFLASFHNPGTIFEQIFVIYQLPRMFIGSFTLVLLYFPTGTAERVRRLQHAACDLKTPAHEQSYVLDTAK